MPNPAIFVTGTTGYIGSYVATNLLREHPSTRLALLVRAKSQAEAEQRLWKSLQLHMGFEEFLDHVRTRCDLYLGDLTLPELGLEPAARAALIQSMDSIIHVAASLNRKSNKVCFNVNLRGTLEVLKYARAAQDQHGLRRFSDISTVAVCGERQNEVVTEDRTIDWDRSDYDPYARTKKFAEHMAHELLKDVDVRVFRPSIVLGDSRFPETTQFDMVRAFVVLTDLLVLPFSPDWKADIVPADYVGKAIVHVHQKERPKYGAYNLASGTQSLTYKQITDFMHQQGMPGRHVFVPRLQGAFKKSIGAAMDTPRGWGLSGAASLMHVFLPYLTFNTVFDNARVVEELGEAPAPFDSYGFGLYQFAKRGKFTYPYRPWPEGATPRPSGA